MVDTQARASVSEVAEAAGAGNGWVSGDGLRRAAGVLRAVLISFAALCAVAGLARAQGAGAATESVTILTDEVGRPNSRASNLIIDLARRVNAEGRLRVLAAAGRGGADNIRDLLFLKGIDFVVVNADVYAHMARTKDAALARRAQREVRYVSKLYDQRVLVLVRRDVGRGDVGRGDVAGVAALDGRRVGLLTGSPASRATAETLLAAAGIRARVEAVDAPAGRPARAFDGLIVLESEFQHLARQADQLAGFRPLSLTMSADLAKIYRPATFMPGQVPGFATTAPIATVAVDTVLAVYNWRDPSDRRRNAVALIDALFKAVAPLRRTEPDTPWRQVDIAAEVPGWQRYDRAEPSRFLDAAELGRVAAVDRIAFFTGPGAADGVRRQPDRTPTTNPFAKERDAAAAVSTASTAPVDRDAGQPEQAPAPDTALRILAIERPPLSGKELANGGLTLELARAAIDRGGETTRGRRLEITWVKADDPELLARLEAGAVDLIVPWEALSCDDVATLSRATALLCDQAQFSVPLMSVVIGLFVPNDSTIDLTDLTTLAKKRICVAEARDLTMIGLGSADWQRRHGVEIVRKPSVAVCFATLQVGGADGLLANDIEGRFALRQLGVGGLYRGLRQPVAIRNVSVVIPRNRPGAERLRAAVNRGIAAVRSDPAYRARLQTGLRELVRAPTTSER